MATRCMRPGCDRPAGARLTYDPVACELWLDPITTPTRAAVQELCEFHVERLTVPRGWVATDRRVAATEAAPEPAVEVQAGADPEPEPEAGPDRAPVVDPDPGTDPEPEPVVGHEGSGHAPASGGSSMLARAFAWTGPQHSVLTTPAGVESEDDGSQG